MSRSTIDFGIDLGTTNSTIAVLKGTQIEIFKNNSNAEYTPSVVWIDKQNALWVGQKAKEQLESDPENTFAEFKLQMGQQIEHVFARSQRRMKPEDLSAEVLMSLRANVKKRTDEELQAAVVTVPAAFDLPQCEATNKAARLAGFSQSPLLQEPVAAALAYGFQSSSEKVFWLVYDFGGGTFDAAVVQLRDGVIQVVNHGGDNQLGGKLLDWEIVDSLLIPAVTEQFLLPDFTRGNRRWSAAISKLKLHAEKAKIELSEYEQAYIEIDFLCQDESGKAVNFEYELKRSDVERLAEPYIVRSINICKNVLTEKRLGSSDIEKVLLVGGPTLMPFLRNRLKDPAVGLGIPLDFSLDPLTVVAHGAAVFAGTQRREVDSRHYENLKENQYAVKLEYKPVGADTEPLVGGQVIAPNQGSLEGFSIEFVNTESHPQWRSGKIRLAPNGFFTTSLWAEKGCTNTFFIELSDPHGTLRQIYPGHMVYTVGFSITDPPLIHSIGIALANNEVRNFFEKGRPLPLRMHSTQKTAYDAQCGQTGDLIKIPVIEGDNRLADRNRLIGSITIRGDQIKRDVPVGSEVEITIEIDQSRLVRAMAYIPILDEEFEGVLKLNKQVADRQTLASNAEKEKKRVAEIRKKVAETGDTRASGLLRKVDQEHLEREVDSTLLASGTDPDAADKCESRILALRVCLDDIECALEWPYLIREAEALIKETDDIIKKYGKDADKKNFLILEQETGAATGSRDSDVLRRKINEIESLQVRVLREQPGWWVAVFENLCERKASMKNASQATSLISEGNRAIDNSDLDELKAVIQKLIVLLPENEQGSIRKGFGSTIL